MSMNSLESLVMRLAENRAAMRKVKSDIDDLFVDADGSTTIDLSRYRDYWYECTSIWQGWIVAINNFDGDEATPEEKALARLLDEKATLRQEYGRIKRSLCAAGRKLIRSKQ